MIIDWNHAGPSVSASFLASLVEFVEALTIILAVGSVRGWRPAMIGSAAGAAFLALLVMAFGPSLQRVPITSLQLAVGVLLLLFGMRWLRKAILRAGGIIGLHDEEAIFQREKRELETQIPMPTSFDWVAAMTTFKAVVVEGLEVVFIVIATGATGRMLAPAAIGATAAGLLVVLLGLAIHRPLSRIPENTLKFAVGVLLSSFGVFWLGEGLQFRWPGEDLSLFGLIAGFLFFAVAASLGIRAQFRKEAL